MAPGREEDVGGGSGEVRLVREVGPGEAGNIATEADLIAVVAHATPAGEDHAAGVVTDAVAVGAAQVGEPDGGVLLVPSTTTSAGGARTEPGGSRSVRVSLGLWLREMQVRGRRGGPVGGVGEDNVGVCLRAETPGDRGEES